MKRRAVVIPFFFLLILPLRAQERPEPVPAIGQDRTYSDELILPLPVSAKSVPLAFASESARNNYILGGIQAGSGFDDNALSSPDHAVSDVSYLFLPHLEIGQSREYWNWNLAYSPGFTINQRFSERNQAAQNLNLTTEFHLTPHIALQLIDSFEKTNDLFAGQLGTSLTLTQIEQPNTSPIIPLAERTGNTSAANLTYHFGRDSVLGANGDYYFVNYGAIAGTGGEQFRLIDSRSSEGGGFYAHRFGGRQWMGAIYGFQRLTFVPGDRTDVQRPMLFYAASITTHMTLSIWAGPEYSTTFLQTTAFPRSRLLGTGGAAYMWQGNRTSLQAKYARHISDGGGLAEAVTYQEGSGEIRQQLARSWAANAALGYAQNHPLIILDPAMAPFHGWIGSAGLQYRITEHLAADMKYERQQQRYEQSLLPPSTFNRNRAWLSISYTFTRPLGR